MLYTHVMRMAKAERRKGPETTKTGIKGTLYEAPTPMKSVSRRYIPEANPMMRLATFFIPAASRPRIRLSVTTLVRLTVGFR